MKINPFKRAICILLVLMFCASAFVIPGSASDADISGGGSVADERLEDMKKYLDSDSYRAYYDLYTVKAGEKEGTGTYTAEFDASQSSLDAHVLTPDERVKYGIADDYAGTPIYSPSTGDTSFTVTIPEDDKGMFYIVIEYISTKETVNSIERKLYLDDRMPFSEASALSMTKTWSYNYVGKDGYPFEKDVNDNDLTPAVSETGVWRSYICSDSNGYTNEYYQFFLTAGEHTITLSPIREAAIFGSVRVVSPKDNTYAERTYAQYLDAIRLANNGVMPGEGSGTVHIKAEKPYFVSDSSVMMTNNKTSSITEPSSPYYDQYNVIGANSYNAVGQWAAYKFEVQKTGMYTISMRYMQNALEGMFISRAIKLSSESKTDKTPIYQYGLADGTPTVPFTEAYSARFDYESEWQVGHVGGVTTENLASEKQKNLKTTFELFFEEGVEYTIYFEVSLGALAEQLQRVETTLTKLNECYLQILRLTGPEPDENTDYGFSRMIPEVIYELNKQAVELHEVRQNFAEICGVETASHLATMDNVIRLVATMGKADGSEIAENLANLKTNLGTLGTWITSSKASTLIVDYIDIQPKSAEQGEADCNFFVSAWFEIRAFFASFFTEYDNMGVRVEVSEDDYPLDVWIASGRDQSKVVRNLIDAKFTDYCVAEDYKSPQTGSANFPVALKLVTGGTLLPSILAGKGPDVYMGLDAASVMNYAIREAILPVSGLRNFEAAKDQFHTAAMDAIKLPDLANGMKTWNYYGLPMTMSFAMMFYRMDFLVQQGVGVPKTWDELLKLLPTLQENNMDVGLNYVLALDFFLYQNGGNMWLYTDDIEYAGAQIGLNSPEGQVAFEFCTDLYALYSFPVYFDAANRFRTGEMPIVIQDYVGTYNQLIVFATEIEGLWSFSQIPGVERTNENGEKYIDHTSMAGVTAAVITSNGKDRQDDAWEFVKWCTGDDYISEYSNRIVSILGPSAKYAGANPKALANMSWTSEERAAIEEQLEWLDTIVNFPGSYIIARYTNFAFLSVVNEGEPAVDALDEYIGTINSEITRKREEFGMATLEPNQTPDEAKADKAGQ